MVTFQIPFGVLAIRLLHTSQNCSSFWSQCPLFLEQASAPSSPQACSAPQPASPSSGGAHIQGKCEHAPGRLSHPGESCRKIHPYHSCCCLVAKSYPTHCNPMDCSPPDSFVHGILQARILQRVATSFSRGSSQPKDGTCISCIGRQSLHHPTSREVHHYSFL